MSHAATNWAIRQKGLKPATKIVLWHLADCHNGHTGQCNPRQDTLAAECEMSRSTLNLHLDKLEEMGLIQRHSDVDPGTKRQRPTHYTLAMDAPAEPKAVSENRTRAAQDVVEPCPKTGHGAVSEKPAEPCPNFGESRVLKSDTIENPGKEPGREPEEGREAPRRKFRLPQTWCLSAAGWAYAREHGIPDQIVRDEAQGFHVFWMDRGDRRSEAGWEQTWQGWVRRIAPRYRTASQQPKGRRDVWTDAFLSAAYDAPMADGPGEDAPRPLLPSRH